MKSFADGKIDVCLGPVELGAPDDHRLHRRSQVLARHRRAGNTMAPGFVLTDFEGANSDELIARWPRRAEMIRSLTRHQAR